MWTWKNILTAIIGFGLLIAIYLTRGDAKKGDANPDEFASTLVLDPQDGCATGYSNGGGHKLEVPDGGGIWVELDSVQSADSTVRTFNMQLERKLDGRWVPQGNVRKVAKKARWQAFPYRGLPSGQYRVAFWRDSTDCSSATIRSAENGVRLEARSPGTGGS